MKRVKIYHFLISATFPISTDASSHTGRGRSASALAAAATTTVPRGCAATASSRRSVHATGTIRFECAAGNELKTINMK